MSTNPSLKYLKCYNCSNTTLHNYECLKCGRLRCHKCIKQSYCHHCQKKSEFKRSKLSDRIINNTITNCPFCNIEIIYKNLNDHKAICAFGIFDCSILNCKFSGAREDFINHIQTNHEKDLISLFDNNTTKEIVNNQKDKEYFEYPNIDNINSNTNEKCNIQ